MYHVHGILEKPNITYQEYVNASRSERITYTIHHAKKNFSSSTFNVLNAGLVALSLATAPRGEKLSVALPIGLVSVATSSIFATFGEVVTAALVPELGPFVAPLAGALIVGGLLSHIVDKQLTSGFRFMSKNTKDIRRLSTGAAIKAINNNPSGKQYALQEIMNTLPSPRWGLANEAFLADNLEALAPASRPILNAIGKMQSPYPSFYRDYSKLFQGR